MRATRGHPRETEEVGAGRVFRCPADVHEPFCGGAGAVPLFQAGGVGRYLATGGPGAGEDGA